MQNNKSLANLRSREGLPSKLNKPQKNKLQQLANSFLHHTRTGECFENELPFANTPDFFKATELAIKIKALEAGKDINKSVNINVNMDLSELSDTDKAKRIRDMLG